MNKNYSASITNLDSVLAQNPQDEVALYWKAHGLYELKRYPESSYFALRALSVDTNYFDPYVVLIFSLFKSGDTGKAAEYLKVVLNGDVKNYSLLFARTTEWTVIWGPYKSIFLAHQNKLKEIQTHLKEMGFYNAVVDARVGTNTEAAIKHFEERNGVISPPLVDNLLSRLRVASKQLAAPANVTMSP